MGAGILEVVGFSIYTVEMPMRFSVSHSLAQRSVARNILVCARGVGGVVGWGESCPRAYVTGETIGTVKSELSNNILPEMVGMRFSSFEDLTGYLRDYFLEIDRDQQAAFCAAELAVLDLAGKTFGVSAGSVIGPIVKRKIRYSGVIAVKDPAKVRKYSWAMRLFRFREVKVKVGPSLKANLEKLGIVRRIMGPKVGIRVDANCAWESDEAIAQIKAMSKFGLCGVEQPVGGGDYEGMRRVTAEKLVPVIADESMCSMGDAERLIAEKGCDVFNIRVCKCGGLINSFDIYRKAVAAGIGCQLGCQVGESVILSAAGRHIGTRCEGLKWFEGSYGRLLLKRKIGRRGITIRFGGWGRSLDGDGLGVEPVGRRINESKIDLVEIA
ncbi:MAG: hypothetical protein FVQ79_08155 [Planctomycetes bacterium]|nr:hypothetical protein [Planctomycetota bacterium]